MNIDTVAPWGPGNRQSGLVIGFRVRHPGDLAMAALIASDWGCGIPIVTAETEAAPAWAALIGVSQNRSESHRRRGPGVPAGPIRVRVRVRVGVSVRVRVRVRQFLLCH